MFIERKKCRLLSTIKNKRPFAKSIHIHLFINRVCLFLLLITYDNLGDGVIPQKETTRKLLLLISEERGEVSHGIWGIAFPQLFPQKSPKFARKKR